MRVILVAILLAALIAGAAWFAFKPKEWEITTNEADKASIRGDKDQARDLYLKAIEQAKANGGGISYMVNALVQMPNVSFEQKEKLLESSLAQGEKYGEDSKEVEFRLDALAGFYEHNNPPHLDQAENCIRRMLSNSIKVYGPTDPFFKPQSRRTEVNRRLHYPSEMYARLAQVLERQGKMDEAREFYRKAGPEQEEQFLKRASRAPLEQDSDPDEPHTPVTASPY